MTPQEKRYEKKIQEVNLIVSEVECVNALQTQVEFANKHVMKSAKLRVVLENC